MPELLRRQDVALAVQEEVQRGRLRDQGADVRGQRRLPLRAPLQLRELPGLPALRGCSWHQRLAGRGDDRSLAQSREYLRDVVEEATRRSEDQHTLDGEVLVAEEKVGDAVQRDYRLSRTRATLHDQQTGGSRTHDLVLLALQRGDGSAHSACPAGGQRRQKRALADEITGFTVHIEGLVVDSDNRRPVGPDVPPTPLALWVKRCRGVERPCRGRAPVEHQWLGIVVGAREADPPQMTSRPVDGVEPAEDQAAHGMQQLGPPVPETGEPGRLHRIVRVGLEILLDSSQQLAPAALCQVDDLLLLRQGIGSPSGPIGHGTPPGSAYFRGGNRVVRE